MTAPNQEGNGENSSEPDGVDSPDPLEGDEPWYGWNRWKYIGGALFLILSVAGVSYVIWDIVDLLPKPVTIGVVRAALRESPGRITDIVALAGLISFGPPAGVDLMFGATAAAKQWARERQRKERAKGRAEGRVEGRAEERERIRKRFQSLAENNPDVRRLLDELQDEDSV